MKKDHTIVDSNGDAMMKSNMDFAPPRGMLPPQPTMNQQNVLLRNQMPPALPPQLQNQFQQIRHAVVNGVIPPQVLAPQVMSPQHMHALLQLISKTAESQNLQVQINRLIQNKNIPPLARQQQVEQLSRVLRQFNQQIEAQRGAIMQNVLQKTQGNLTKSNGPVGGLDLGGMRNPGGQSMLSPLNSMGALGQALPLSSMASSNARMPKTSRFNDTWKAHNSSGPGAFDNTLQQQQQPNFGFNPGPSGDSVLNGMRYNSPMDELSMNKPFFSSLELPTVPDPFPSASAQEAVAPPNAGTSSLSDQSAALADFGPPEFTPGVPWKGFCQIDPEADPNITPGSYAIAKTMSINTVRDADQVLKRDRNALSESSTGAQGSSSTADQPTSPISSAITVSETTSTVWSSGAGAANVATHNNARAGHDPWKGASRVSLSSQTLHAKKAMMTSSQAPSSWDRSGVWDQSQQAPPQQGGMWNSQGSRSSWLVLTNFNSQVDVMLVRQVCMQQGSMMSFQPQCPMDGMALVKYATPEDAENAQKTLNMQTFGSTMLVASVATDQDVSNFASAAGGQWGSAPGAGSRYMAGVGSTGGFMSQPPQQPVMMPGGGTVADPGLLPSSIAGQQLWNSPLANNVPSWPNPSSSSVPWSGGGAESPMHSLLPENLLGGENM